MSTLEFKFEKGKCYKAFNSDYTTIELFKFESFLDFSRDYVSASRGITLNAFGITIGWCTSYIGDLDVEEIDESIIDKVVKLFNMDRVTILATINGKKDE